MADAARGGLAYSRLLAPDGPALGSGEAELAQIRVVQGVMPPILATIVRDVALSAAGTIVADAVPASDLLRVVARFRPDVVVITALAELAVEPLDALICGGGWPVRLIVLSASGEDAKFHEMRQHVTILEDLSSDALRAAMRGEGAAHG